MSMDGGVTISTVAQLLLLTSSPQYQESRLINRLNEYYNFDHNILVVDAFGDRSRFFNLSAPQSFFVCETVNKEIIGLDALTSIDSKNTFLIAAPGSVNYEENKFLFWKIKGIQMLDMNMKVGVFFATAIPAEEVRKLLDSCWQGGIVNIFVAFGSDYLNVVRSQISEASQLQVINVTGKEWFKNVFPSKFVNLYGHPFISFTPKAKIDMKLWTLIFRAFNITFQPAPLKSTENSLLQRYTHCLYLSNTDYIWNLMNSYPIRTRTLVMVVPESLPYSKLTNYLTAISSDLLFVAILFTILTTILLLVCIRHINEGNFKFFQSMADVLNILLFIDNGNIKYQRLFLTEAFVVVSLTFGGFFIVNVFLSLFQSHLTRPYKLPELNTPEDIYRSPFLVMTGDELNYYDLERLLDIQWKNDGWYEKVVKMNETQILHQVLGNNRHMVFAMEEEQAKSFVKLLKQFTIRKYRIPSEVGVLQREFSVYRLCQNFPYADQLNEMFHIIHSAGLYERWEEEDLQFWLKGIQSMQRNNASESTGTDDTDDQLHFIIIYGWIAASVVFVLELLWVQVKKFKILRQSGIQESC